VRKTLLAFLVIIEKSTGRLPIIYTDANIGNSYLDGSFKRYPLWIANYSNADAPSMPVA
jgi:lysozyme